VTIVLDRPVLSLANASSRRWRSAVSVFGMMGVGAGFDGSGNEGGEGGDEGLISPPIGDPPEFGAVELRDARMAFVVGNIFL
jgi:hypothetical protein